MKEKVKNEVERILPMLPIDPPDDTLEIVKGRGYLLDNRLIYGCEWVYDERLGKKVRKVKAICTACGGESFLEYVENGCGRYGATNGFIDPYDGEAKTDGNCCICPSCGCGTTAMRRPASGRSSEINNHIFLSLHKVEGYLVLLSWVIRKLVRHDGTVFYKADGYEGITVIDKTIVRLKAYNKYMTSLTWLDHWEYTQRYDYQLGSFDTMEVVNLSYEETDGTECEKSALVPYLKNQFAGALYPSEYLKLWLKHPNLENLVTAGYGNIVNDAISNASGYFGSYSCKNFDPARAVGAFDLKKVRPTDILGIDHEDIPIAKIGSVEKLSFYRWVKDNFSVMLSPEQLEFCKKQGYPNIKEVIDLGNKYGHDVKIVKLLNYLQKQADAQAEVYYRSLVNASHLRDYWEMLYKVYRTLPDELIYPRDLRTAHDEIQQRIEDEANAKVNEMIVERVSELSRFNYYNEDTMLFIRPAASYKEFKIEGKTLNHCVATYAKKHAEGVTSIFFIRSIDEPDKPYYTLELKIDGKKVPYVVQNRGKSNCARTEEVKRFEEFWLEHVKKILIKEKNNGKRNRKSGNSERIGA